MTESLDCPTVELIGCLPLEIHQCPFCDSPSGVILIDPYALSRVISRQNSFPVISPSNLLHADSPFYSPNSATWLPCPHLVSIVVNCELLRSFDGRTRGVCYAWTTPRAAHIPDFLCREWGYWEGVDWATTRDPVVDLPDLYIPDLGLGLSGEIHAGGYLIHSEDVAAQLEEFRATGRCQ